MRRNSEEDTDRVPVNRILPFSSVDGPGNRSVVFLQGCGFDCKYCHNPETRNLCISCGDCVSKCPTHAIRLTEGKVTFDPKICCGCDTCIKTCTYGASPRIRWMNAQEVYAEVIKQKPFIRGATISGGECTTYPDFLTQLLTLCRKDGLSTLLDSNGSLLFENHPELLAVTDGVMLDIKAWDATEHQNVTGTDNGSVLKNMIYLAERNKLYEIRTVVVPELFNCEQTVRETVRMLRPFLSRSQIRYKLICYRPMGVREVYSHYNIPSGELMQHLADVAHKEGMQDIIII